MKRANLWKEFKTNYSSPTGNLIADMLSIRSIVSMVFVAALGLSGLCLPAQDPQHHADQHGSYDPAMVEAGAKLFVGSCSVCHGIDGRGSARGPDLTQGLVVNRGTDDEVSQVIRNGVPGSSMPPSDFPQAEVRQIVAFIRSLSIKAAQLSVAGDLNAGRQVFFGKGRCSECHMIRGEGGLLGPELSNLGAERTLAEIRQSILQPGASAERKYKPLTVVTEAGEKITGVLRNRDNFSLQMIDQNGRLRFFLARDLRKVEAREKSLMPDNYETLLRSEELQDLLTYLSRQTVVAGSDR